MSLKAKLEAVIYAAEEPVTLGQLAALFAADALEFKAAQETAAREHTAEVAALAVAPTDPAPLLAEGLEFLNLTNSPDLATDPSPEALEPFPDTVPRAEDEPRPVPESPTDPASEPTAEPAAESAPDVVSDPADATPASTPESPAVAPSSDALPDDHSDIAADQQPSLEESEANSAEPDLEAEARKLARQRDREIKAILKGILDEIIAESATDTRGVEIREIAGGYRMATKPECHDAVRLFVKSLKPAMKLSLPALETLAVVAYKQPVTAPEVSEIRGVESAGVLGSLLSRKLIATAGRKQVIGRPILYKTTKEFLLRFGLKDLTELPSMEEFEKMAGIEIEEAPADEASSPHAGDQALLAASSPDGEELADEAAVADLASAHSQSADADLAATETGQPTPEPTGPEPTDPASADLAAIGEAPAAEEDASEEAAGDPASALGLAEVEPSELTSPETDTTDESAATKNAEETQPGEEPGQAHIEASRDGKEDEEER